MAKAGREPRPYPASAVLRFRHPAAPGLSLTGVRLAIPGDASGSAALPGASVPVQVSVIVAQNHPSVSAFPGPTAVSACTLSFSRLAQRSLTLRPTRSRGHLDVAAIGRLQTLLTSMPAPVASGWSGCRAGLVPAGEAPPFHGARGKWTACCDGMSVQRQSSGPTTTPTVPPEAPRHPSVDQHSAVIRKQLDRVAEAAHRIFADAFEIEIAIDKVGERA